MSVSDKQKPSDTVSETNQHDALSVLRDLVALHYEKYTGKDVTWVTDRMAHEDIVWARARSLVAEHTPDEERQ